jgi:drug/metabolite transporter (DMT)-like permease
METQQQPERWKTLLAFAIIYLVWGSTYLAIRIGVREVPPFLLAAMRFLAAGLILFLWQLARGEKPPDARQWIGITVLSAFLFVLDYGSLFWAEQRVPSGIAAVMLATIPAFTALSEIVLLRTRALTLSLAVALLTGIVGVGVLVGLVGPSSSLGGSPIDRTGAAVLMVGALSWSIASVMTRRMSLPSSKAMSSGAQMLAGGVLLTVTSLALGEFRDFHPAAVSREAWLSLAYLTVAGSIVAFTAWVWLMHHVSPTKVGTYAYVNPVVAIVLGYFLGGEALGPRTMLGTLLIMISVLGVALSRTGART